jgi:hypothetical protein
MTRIRRRELIKLIAALTGAAFVGGRTPYAAVGAKGPAVYSDDDTRFFDDVAETIMPRTETPGARDAAVGAFITRYSAARYEPAHIAILKDGIAQINARMQELHGVPFRQATPEQKQSVLTAIDRQAKDYVATADRHVTERVPHYFTLVKQLTLFGFFTSELGATRVSRYRPIPGKYKGCVPYTPGETFWAW